MQKTQGCQIKYSIIIPHYEDVERLERCCDSIPFERKDIQTIVVDDCSPSQDKLCDFEKKYPSVQLIKAKENKGAGAARNIGLNNIQGEYVLFADTDDTFLEDTFEILDKTLLDTDLTYYFAEGVVESTLEPSIRAIGFNSLCKNYLENKISLEKLNLGHVVPWAKVYRANFLKSIGTKFEETFVSNDVYFNVVASLQAQTIKVIPQAIYKVFRLSDSLTSTVTPERFLERVRVSANLSDKLGNLLPDYKMSGATHLINSIKFGPTVFLKTFFIIYRSRMIFNLKKILSVRVYVSFFKHLIVEKREINAKGKTKSR